MPTTTRTPSPTNTSLPELDCPPFQSLVRAIAPPPGIWSWVWVVAAGVVGLGVARAALRWPHLPPGRVLPTAGYVALGALVLAVTA